MGFRGSRGSGLEGPEVLAFKQRSLDNCSQKTFTKGIIERVFKRPYEHFLGCLCEHKARKRHLNCFSKALRLKQSSDGCFSFVPVPETKQGWGSLLNKAF